MIYVGVIDITKRIDSKVKECLMTVSEAMTCKGYDPMYQLIGYITTEDPTYITNHMDARKLITQIDRDELLEEILRITFKHIMTEDKNIDTENKTVQNCSNTELNRQIIIVNSEGETCKNIQS